jgi:hypothetical protein
MAKEMTGKPGEVLGIVKLTNIFGKRAAKVLACAGFITEAPDRKRGAPRSFVCKQLLPTLDTYREMERVHFSVTVADAISNAEGEAESLKDELQEWFDNLPENFQQGDKGSQLEEAVSALESVQFPTLPDWFEEWAALVKDRNTFVFFPSDGNSRADRGSDAAGQLRQAGEKLRELGEGLEQEAVDLRDDEDEDPKREAAADLASERGDELTNLADELESAADELDGVEYPGMY